MSSFLCTLYLTFLIYSNALQIFDTDSADQYRDGVISCNGNEDCQIICDQTNGCKNALINCPNGYLCDITCSATKSCDNSTIIATYSSSLTINDCANGFFTCKGLKIYLPPNKNSTINGADDGLSQGAGVDNIYDQEPINPMQFYAIYGWKDINIINYSGSYQYHGGTMHCTIGYDIICPFNPNDWSCQNIADLCNNPPTPSPTDSPTTTEPTISPITATPTTSLPTIVTPITSTATTITSQYITSTLTPTSSPSTNVPTTISPSSQVPTTSMPTNIPTISPSTQTPTTSIPTILPSVSPTTDIPTIYPSTQSPTTSIPTTTDSTSNPTVHPSTESPSTSISTVLPSISPTTDIPTTTLPTVSSSTSNPTLYPSTEPPSTQSPTTSIPTITASTSNPTIYPSTMSPITSTSSITTNAPTISPSIIIYQVTESDESDSNEASQSEDASGLKSGGNSNIPSFLKTIDEIWYIVASIVLCLCCFTLILTYYVVRGHRLQIQLTTKFASTLHSLSADTIILAQKSSNSNSMSPSNMFHNTQNNNNPIHTVTVSPIAEDDDGIHIQYDDIIQEGDAFNDNKLDHKLPDIEMGQLKKIHSTKYLYKARSVSITDKKQSNHPISSNLNSRNHSKSDPELTSIASPPQSIKSMDVDDIEFTKSGTEVTVPPNPSNYISPHPVLNAQGTIQCIAEHKIYSNPSVQPIVSVSMYQSDPMQSTASQQVVSRPIYPASSTMPNISENIPSIQQPVVSRPIYPSPPIQNVSLQPVPQSYPVPNPNTNQLRLSVPVQESMPNIPTIATPDSVLTDLTDMTSTEYISDKSDGDISSDNASNSNSDCDVTSTSTSTSTASSSSSCTATEDIQQEKPDTIPPKAFVVNNDVSIDIPKSDMLSMPRNDNQTMIVISASIEELMSDKIVLPNSDHHKMQSSLWTVTEADSKKFKSVTEIKTPDLNLGTVGDVYGDMFGIKNNLSPTDDDQIDSSVLSEDDNNNEGDKYAD